MLSNETIKRLKALKEKVDLIVQVFDVPEPQAWAMAASSDIQKVMEVAEKIDRQQEQNAIAEMRAKAAYAATFKGNIETKSQT